MGAIYLIRQCPMHQTTCKNCSWCDILCDIIYYVNFEQPQTPEQQVRSRLMGAIKKTRPEFLPESVSSQANELSSILNGLKDEKLSDLSAWPTGFSFSQNDEIRLVGKMGGKSIRASRDIPLGDSPEDFLNNLETFLSSGSLPEHQDSSGKLSETQRPEREQDADSSKWRENLRRDLREETENFKAKRKKEKEEAASNKVYSSMDEFLRETMEGKHSPSSKTEDPPKRQNQPENNSSIKEQILQFLKKIDDPKKITSAWHVLKQAQRAQFASQQESDEILTQVENKYVDELIREVKDHDEITTIWHARQSLAHEEFNDESIRKRGIRALNNLEHTPSHQW